MEQQIDDLTLEMFIGQSLERHTKKFIAGVLGDLEGFTGIKDPQRSQIVKDLANYSKRVMHTKLTGTPVESAHDSKSRRLRPTTET